MPYIKASVWWIELWLTIVPGGQAKRLIGPRAVILGVRVISCDPGRIFLIACRGKILERGPSPLHACMVAP